MIDINLLVNVYLSVAVFVGEQVHVLKPVTSKPGNSEVYVVALDFIGIKPDLLNQLKKSIGIKNIIIRTIVSNKL